MGTERLTEEQISKQLPSTPGWSRVEEEIRREFTFENFAVSIRFVNAVAEIAEDANHHPDIDIRWNKVLLRLSTHSKGGLTNLDFLVARRIDGIEIT